MRIESLSRNEMSPEQQEYFRERVAAKEHKNDESPFRQWENPAYDGKIFIIIEKELNKPIGIIYRAIFNNKAEVAWWVDYAFREKTMQKK